VYVKQPRIVDGEPALGYVDGERRSDGGVPVYFAAEWLADVFQIDSDGYLGADWRQYQRQIFTKVKSVNWQMFMLAPERRDRVESCGAPRFGPEVWSHL
jgi:hypothetical protein